jgi:hypothetical protein
MEGLPMLDWYIVLVMIQKMLLAISIVLFYLSQNIYFAYLADVVIYVFVLEFFIVWIVFSIAYMVRLCKYYKNTKNNKKITLTEFNNNLATDV